MKQTIQLSLFLSAIAILASCTSFNRKPSSADLLENRKFCRQIRTEAGVSSHCVEFKDGKMTDNADTLSSGNPPETFNYTLKLAEDSENKLPRGKVIITKGDTETEVYRLRGSMLANENGAVLADVTDSRK